MLDANKLQQAVDQVTPNFTHLTAVKMPTTFPFWECAWSTGGSGYRDLRWQGLYAGDSDYRFALESISKVCTLALR